MILGAVGCDLSQNLDQNCLAQATDSGSGKGPNRVYQLGPLMASMDAEHGVARDGASGDWLAYSGNPLFVNNAGGSSSPTERGARRLLAMLSSEGLRALERLDGQFAIAWWSSRERSLRLIRDRFGMEPLHYWQRERKIVFASRARDIASQLPTRPGLSVQGLVEYLTHSFLPGDGTLYEGIERVPGGSVLEFSSADGTCRIRNWYRLSFANTLAPDEAQITRQYRDLLEQSIVRRLDDSRTGIFLSGGMDSSSVATFARKHLSGPIRSYSFRCLGESFDESPYARQLAAELGTQHTEVEYGEVQSLQAIDAVGAMDMPFCDIGIEIGTWLLSQGARSNVDYLLTGDGGDEMWASHPVYAAQRIIRWYDRMPVPRPLRSALVSAVALVKDSDKKRNLSVVLKRILPEPAYPDKLQHYRWRMYYTFKTLRNLLSPALASAIADADPFRAVTNSFENYEGPDDGISACLYSDYRGLSSFYFSRLMLPRACGIEVRMPFYDRELVEFGARIPAHLKLEGLERTKRLFRVAMEGVLPDIINHRQDKLGHSVPFKNWLREKGQLSAQIEQTFASQAFNDRGIFRREAVQRMLAEHRARRHNHSHRIWALFVLEQWFRQHNDTASASNIALSRAV
jgi:asparagine synthase (glutamine-hydrolysing)